MELLHLRTFIVVAEEENLTRAAQRLYLTPPTVSAHVKALEEELNVMLFIRSSTGMQLTEKGILLKEKALATLNAAQNLVNHATELQENLIGQLRFGLNASSRLLRIPQLISELETACPGIQLELSSSSTGKLLKQLQKQHLDISFIFDPPPQPEITALPLQDVELAIAVPAIWKDKIQQQNWEELSRLPWVCTDGYCPFQRLIESRFEELDLTFERLVMSDDERTKLDLVRDGVGISLLEYDALEEDVQQNRIIIWKKEMFSAHLHLAFLNRRSEDPLLKALLAVALDIWKS